MNSVFRLDATTSIWTEVSPLPVASMIWRPARLGRISMSSGGGRTRGDDKTAETYCYDTEVDKWTSLEPMPEPCYGHTSVVLGGLIYVLGGFVDVYRLEPVVSGSWSTIAPVPTQRFKCTPFVLARHINVAGGMVPGESGRCRTVTSVERYDK